MKKFLEVGEFESLIKKTTDTLEEFDNLRVGQCLMNELWVINRDVYNYITFEESTELDPFYDDKKTHSFLVEISPVGLSEEENDNISELIVNFSILHLSEQWG